MNGNEDSTSPKQPSGGSSEPSPQPSPGRSPASQRGVQRQIVLPMSKAVEIAWKSIRLRLSRSLLVTSGIVLALAFLMSIRVNDAMIDGMRQWILQTGQVESAAPARGQIPAAPSAIAAAFAGYRRDAQSLRDDLAADDKLIRAAAHKTGATTRSGAGFKAASAFGATWQQLDKEVGPFPVAVEQMKTTLAAEPSLVGIVQRWIGERRKLKAVNDELDAPQRLIVTMQASGVPTSPRQIASEKSRTRWLLALALLVAFVGILNAMLMSVTERFREIGTMKCLGALDSFIIKLFLIESLFQGFVGTVAGTTIGFLLSIASITGTYHGYAWKNVPWGQIGLSALMCLFIGVGLTVAGAVYPARQAARMQPIEAMRVEA